MQEQTTRIENAGVGKPHGKLYSERALSYFLIIVLRFLSE